MYPSVLSPTDRALVRATDYERRKINRKTQGILFKESMAYILLLLAHPNSMADLIQVFRTINKLLVYVVQWFVSLAPHILYLII